MKFKALTTAVLVTICSLSTARFSLAQPNPEAKDQAFLQSYKSLILQFIQSPTSRNILLESVQNNPQFSIQAAKSVCRSLRSGLSMNEIRKIQSDTISDIIYGDIALEQNAAIEAIRLLDSLATTHYCPEFEGS